MEWQIYLQLETVYRLLKLLQKRRKVFSSHKRRHTRSVVPADRKRISRMPKLLVILYIVALVEEGIASPCKYWCKTADWRFYCCDEQEGKMEKKNAWASSMAVLIPHLWFALGWPTHEQDHQHNQWPKVEKKLEKRCPKIRSACPRSQDWWYGPPVYCYDDNDCISSEKCCFDICLDYTTCKPAVF